jgi:hypothetical protein
MALIMRPRLLPMISRAKVDLRERLGSEALAACCQRAGSLLQTIRQEMPQRPPDRCVKPLNNFVEPRPLEQQNSEYVT